MMQFRLIAVVVLAFAALAGCISTETDIELNANGGGDITLTYEFSSELYGMGVFDGSDVARPIPVTRDEFEEAALLAGMRLRSYRSREKDGVVSVTARLSFRDPEALVQLLGPGQLDLSVARDGGAFVYRVVPAGDPDAVSPDLANALAAYTMRTSVRVPSEVIDTNGAVTEDDTVVFETDLGELARSADEVIWTVSW